HGYPDGNADHLHMSGAVPHILGCVIASRPSSVFCDRPEWLRANDYCLPSGRGVRLTHDDSAERGNL
ncbi:MAG: hypothetical protein ACTH9B_14520, partial [Brevibacterium aurantiacum]|nr:hypothetical protein [Brevibacterium sp.]MDN5895936.1 hypothetical protein [Nocardioides sp.]MDN6373951.1 hypothetical protein [Brevibacterium aurantiacum]